MPRRAGIDLFETTFIWTRLPVDRRHEVSGGKSQGSGLLCRKGIALIVVVMIPPADERNIEITAAGSGGGL